MTDVRVDPTRLAQAAGRFDEQGDRVGALLSAYSALMDPVVSGSNPATAPLAAFAESVQGHKDGLEALQQFCHGMADRIRASATGYRATDDGLAAEADALLALVAAAVPAAAVSGVPVAGEEVAPVAFQTRVVAPVSGVPVAGEEVAPVAFQTRVVAPVTGVPLERYAPVASVPVSPGVPVVRYAPVASVPVSPGVPVERYLPVASEPMPVQPDASVPGTRPEPAGESGHG